MAQTLTLITTPSHRHRSFTVTAAVALPPRRSSKSLYEVLRVKETASVREIKMAYRSLAKQAHPDVSAVHSDCSDSVLFLEIKRAYDTLRDPIERARHDKEINPLEIGLGLGCRFTQSNRVGSRRWETDQCW